MKKQLLTIVFACIAFISYTQVTGVNYMIELDETSGFYDCKLVVNSGSATTVLERVQFNSFFTVVVPTGVEVDFIESFNPIILNSSNPAQWQLSNVVISPDEQPENDYYGFSPNINPTAVYDELTEGDVISLFRISADVDCVFDIRPIDNEEDETLIAASGTVYSNGFSIGSTEQVYQANSLPANTESDFVVSDSTYILCSGDCITISPIIECAPPLLFYEWSNGETTPSITVCPDEDQVYDVDVIGANNINASASLSVFVENNFIYFENDYLFCVGQSYLAFAEFGGDSWQSSNDAIASFDNNELMIHDEGTVIISVNSDINGCFAELEITTSDLAELSFEGPNEICVGDTSVLTSTDFGIWSTDNPSVAIINSNGLVIGFSPGITFPTFIPFGNGCVSTSETPIVVLPGPSIENIGSDELCIGETTTMMSLAEGTWASTNDVVATIDSNGLVTAVSPGVVSLVFTETEGCSSTSNEVVVNPSPLIISGAPEICIGETTQVFPTTQGVWQSSNIAVATVDVDGVVTGVGEGIATFVFISEITGCSSIESEEVLVKDCSLNPSLSCDQIEEEDIICDMDILNGFVGQMSPEDSGGNQPDPLCMMNGGGADNILWIGFVAPEGVYDIVVTPFGCQGSGNGNEGIQIGVYKDCTFTEVVQCNAVCSVTPERISNDNLEAGETYYLFIDGCAGSYCDFEITVIGDYDSQCESACDDIVTDASWEYVYSGEFAEDYNIITYTTAENLTNSNDRDHLVFYDYNSGNVFLKENNGNGFLDNEIFLFNNEDHYANGIYHIYTEDIDNDGLTDIILAESNIVTNTGEISDQVSVYQNLDSYTFVRQINEQVCGMEGPNNLEIVDFDNDGMKDIFFVCTDLLYDILWINDWNDTERTNFNSQTFCHVYSGDFNQDGFQDVGLSNELALINNGDRTFSIQDLIAHQASCSSLTYFVEESNTILDPFNASIIDPSDLGTQLCSEYPIGDNENEIFSANIISPDEETIIIPQVEGFHSVDPNSVCLISEDALQIQNVVARQNTKIDLTLNGCTDFLVIEGNQIFAWINPKQSKKILGTAFIDTNANGIFDTNELPLRNVLISIVPGDFSVLTDDEGNYAFSAPIGTYTITAHVNEGEWVETELMINDVEISEPCNEGYNFGFVPNSGPEEMATISMVNTIARCDFETRFTITIENTGEQALEGVMIFTFDDKTTFFSSDIEGSQTVGNTVITDIGPLDPFSPESYKITVKMPGGSSNLPMLAFEAKLYNKFGEEIAAYGYSDQLRCSYDPNDKREFPDREGEENLTLMDEDLEYTIRFQNNGNDTAFLVKIVDPLYPNIDPESIRVMSSSHAVETCIDGTDLIFLFEDIFLVDSTTNYEASQGYVTFRCNVKEGLAEFTEVNNTADIIFDTNEPIVTNQTINTLVTSLCADKDTTLQVTICEGDIYNGYTEAGVYTEVIELPFGCDSVITLLLEIEGITYTQQSFDVCEGGSITILDEVYLVTESFTIIDSTINNNGCLTNVLTFDINAITDVLNGVAEVALCKDETSTIFPELAGTWISNDESVITVDEDGNFTTVNSGSTTLTFTDNQSGCMGELPVTVFAEPVIENLGSNQICVDDNTNVTSDVDGFWISDNEEVAIINDNNMVIGLSQGIANFIFTNSETGCSASLEIEVLPLSDISCFVSTNDINNVNINLYPNPAKESIFIDAEMAWNSITVVDIQGRKLSSVNQTNEGKLEVDVSQYNAGVYMLIFQGESSVFTKRFVKE